MNAVLIHFQLDNKDTIIVGTQGPLSPMAVSSLKIYKHTTLEQLPYNIYTKTHTTPTPTRVPAPFVLHPTSSPLPYTSARTLEYLSRIYPLATAHIHQVQTNRTNYQAARQSVAKANLPPTGNLPRTRPHVPHVKRNIAHLSFWTSSLFLLRSSAS